MYVVFLFTVVYCGFLRKPEKTQGCRDWDPDLCDTGAALQPVELAGQQGAGH